VVQNKGEHNVYVCFESNLTEVHYYIWWIYYRCTTHVSNMMYEFLLTQTINTNEKFVMENRVKVTCKAIGLIV